MTVPLGTGRDAQYAVGKQLVIRQVRVVAAEVEVDAGGAGDGPGDPVLVDQLWRQHAHADGPAPEYLVLEDQVLDLGQPTAHRRDRCSGAAQPSSGQILL